MLFFVCDPDDKSTSEIWSPDVQLWNAVEDSDRYHIDFRWAQEVLRCMTFARGEVLPRNLLPQVNGGWTVAPRKDLGGFCDFVLPELEHLHRNVKIGLT